MTATKKKKGVRFENQCDPTVQSDDWKVSFKVLTHQAKMHP